MYRTSFLNACAFRLAALAIPLDLGAQVVAKYPGVRAQSTNDSTARGPHAVQPERPTVATHAGTVACGFVELEEGGEWDKAPEGSAAIKQQKKL